MKNLILNFIFNSFQLFLSKFGFLIYSFFAFHVINEEGFGVVSYVSGTILFLQTLATMGLAIAITKQIAAAKNKKASISIAAASFQLSFVVLVIANITLFLLNPNDPIMNLSLLIGSIAATSSVIFKAIYNGFEDFKSPMKASFFAAFVGTALLFVLTYYYGIKGGLAAVCLTYVISCAFLFLYNRIVFSKVFRGVLSRLQVESLIRLLKDGLPNFLAACYFSFGFWLCMHLLKIGDLKELGIHNAVNQYFMVAGFLPLMLSQVLFPRMVKGNFNSKFAVLKVSFLSVLLSIILTALVLLFANFLANAYEVEQLYFYDVLFFCMLSSVFVSMQSVIDNKNVASGKSWAHSNFNLFWMLSLMLLIFFHGSSLTALDLMKYKLISYILRSIALYIYFWKSNYE